MIMESNTGTYVFDKVLREWRMVSDRAHGNPDAYFKESYFEPHFAEKGKPFGQEVRSKRHKQYLMNKLGVHESGDKIRGSYY